MNQDKDKDVFFVPKRTRQKKKQKRLLWQWRVNSKPPSERQSFLKHTRRMQRYAERGQLRNNKFFCKAGQLITQERVDRYEPMCHFMVRKFYPVLSLRDTGYSYDDFVNQCRVEVFLAILNGFDPFKVMDHRERSKEQMELEIRKLEQSIVYGRLRDYLRRSSWKYHPEQLGGITWSIDQLLDRESENGHNIEYRYSLYTESNVDPLGSSFRMEVQKDQLLEILEKQGPEAVKKAFFELDRDSRDTIKDILFRESENRWTELSTF
jgi:hypothetical protein